MGTYFKSGAWNVMCDVCGRKFKSDEIKKRWDGLLVCVSDYENRNILDFTRVKPEMGSVPESNPEPADVFIDVSYITLSTSGIAIAGFIAGDTTQGF